MSARDVIYTGPHVTVRRAAEADNAALCEVVRRVHLRSQLDVTQERDPDFFALPRMHLGEPAVYLGENAEGFVGGCGSVMRAYPFGLVLAEELSQLALDARIRQQVLAENADPGPG